MSSEKKSGNNQGFWIMISMALAFLIAVSGIAANTWELLK